MNNSQRLISIGILLALLFCQEAFSQDYRRFSLTSGEIEMILVPLPDRPGYYLRFERQGHPVVRCGDNSDYLKIMTVPEEKIYSMAIDSATVTPEGLQIRLVDRDLGVVYRETYSPAKIDGESLFISKIEFASYYPLNIVIEKSFQTISHRKPFFLIPGYLYGSNNHAGAGDVFPQLAYQAESATPASGVFYMRSDRSSHCSVEAVYGRTLLAVATDEGIKDSSGRFFYHGLGLDTRSDLGDRLVLTCGYRNFPSRYNGNCSAKRAPRWEKDPESVPIAIQPGEIYTTQHYLYISEAPNRFAFEKAQRVFYWIFHNRPHPKSTRSDALEAISSAILSDSLVDGCNLYRVIDQSDECDIGWTGGMMIACPLLRSGQKLGNQEMEQAAIRSIDSLCKNGLNPQSGFFYDAWRDGQWTTDGWWKHWSGGSHLAYTNGQAVYYILRSYNLLSSDKKTEKEFWIDQCRKVLQAAVSQQKRTGQFPVAYSPEDGSSVDREGFAGCWWIPALSEFYRIKGEEEFLDSAKRGEKFYFQWLSEYEIWGTPIDAAGATDQEGNIALVLGCYSLYRATGKDLYLDHTRHALNYDFSWKYAYRSHTPNEPLHSLDWDSTGGNATSCCNIHLHQMGTLLAEPMYELYLKTRDPYIRERLRDTLIFSLGTYNRNDREFGFGNRGWVTEQFYHTDAIQGATPADGGIWKRYLPWSAACVLEGLNADIPDSFYQ